MEYLDLYDSNKKLTGEKIIRDKGRPQVPSGRYINIVIIFIQNSKGEFLIQKTSSDRGNIWATTGGHVKSGDTCDQTIVKELYEELGLSLKIDDITHLETIKFDFAFQDVYYMKKDINIDDLILQKEEVECVKWLTVEEIKELISKEEFRKGNIIALENIIKSDKYTK